MIQTPNLDLLRDAYMIIDGIPDKSFNLMQVYSTRKVKADCGTIACAAGWLALHPDFQALGLKYSPDSFQLISMQGVRNNVSYKYKLNKLFNIRVEDAQALFGGRRNSKFNSDHSRTVNKLPASSSEMLNNAANFVV